MKILVNFAIIQVDLIFLVKDNGHGFDAEGFQRSKKENFGLMGMAERFEMLDGTFKIQSWPDRGTRVFGKVPQKALKKCLVFD